MKRLHKPRVVRSRLWLASLPLTLTVIGVFFVFEASAVKSFYEIGNGFHYFQLQVIWVILGTALMIAFAHFDYHRLYYFAFSLMLFTIVCLFLVLIPGIGHSAGGARRWIDLGVFRFQPTELAKLAAIIYLSAWFIGREKERFFSFMILLGMLMFLIMLQPDMGTAIIIFLISICIYFIAGIQLHYLAILLPVTGVLGWIMIKLSPYRARRLLAFINPELDPQGITYHINQIIISLRNGGWFGTGFAGSRQKYLFLPEAHTDSIFAIIGEETGLIGACLLIGGFIWLSLNLYRIAVSAPDRFGRLLAGGIWAFFNLQLLINLGGMVNLIPLTGVPLLFISYGGSHLLVSFVLMGIIINIAKQRR